MDQAIKQPSVGQIFRNILLIFAGITLPGISFAYFGWLHLFLPLIIFFFLTKYGLHIGNRFIVAGIALSFMAGIVTGTLGAMLFSFSLIPASYMLNHSGFRGNSPPLSGLKGVATQTLCWWLLLMSLGVITGESAYGSLITTITSALDETLIFYRQDESLSPDALLLLENGFYQAKLYLPLVMPSLFLSCAMFSIWFTMVLGNRLAIKFCNRAVWVRYRFWKLPEKLIWLAIGSGVLSIIPAVAIIKSIGINTLILLCIVYCFQGFSICVFFMNKWNVPLLFRSIIYVTLIFQSFGTIAFLALGLADTWFDFRKLSVPEKKKPNSDKDEE